MNSLRPDLFTVQEIVLNKEVQDNTEFWKWIFHSIVEKFGGGLNPDLDNIVLSN